MNVCKVLVVSAFAFLWCFNTASGQPAPQNIAVIEVTGGSQIPPPPPPNLPPPGGLVRMQHQAFQGAGGASLVTMQINNSATVPARDSNHATSVASRLFPDNGLSVMPINGG